jgi:hypothetical protein
MARGTTDGLDYRSAANAAILHYHVRGILWGSFLAGERMSEKPTMTLDEIISVEMQHKLILVAIDELYKTVQIPLFADHLSNDKEVRQLESAEAKLSVIITKLRCNVPVKKNEATIIDLTARLNK